LKSIQNPPAVILTTAFSDYALEGYDLNIVDYLLKPFSFQRFVKAVSKVKESGSKEKTSLPDKSIFIKSGYEYIKLDIKEILFIKSDMDYTEIHVSEKYHVSSESLTNWEKRLQDDLFTRIHKSYLVNISKIKKISGNRILLETDKELPLGRAYKEAFMQKYIK
jgi:DNA-binding LytR/AlgR family response regulator